jgi:hypothetical protein
MRIPAEALSAIRTELVQAHQCGVTGQHFEPTSALNSLLVELDYRGVEIVPKAAARPDVVRVPKSDAGRVETRVPDGSPTVGTAALLTPEGERLVSAFASKDWSSISDRDYRRFIGLVDRVLEGDTTSAQIRELALRIVNKTAPETLAATRTATYATAERPITPEDFTGEVEPEKPAVHPVTEAVREKLAQAIPGVPVFAYTRRPLTDDTLPRITVEWGKTVNRDLVLFNCEDYEGNEAAAKALGLDSYPLEEPVTLGWLIDEHGAFRQALQTLFWDLTNGVRVEAQHRPRRGPRARGQGIRRQPAG